MHGHCNHTGKIRSAADSQNTQHNSFLRFESYAAFSQRLISLYSLYYTHPRGKFNRFVQFVFHVFIYFAQSMPSSMNCRKVFLQFILHFCNCIPCFGILQKCRSSVKKSTYFCRFSAILLQCRFSDACHLAYLSNAPSFRALESAKTGRSPQRLLPVLPIIRQKFVKYRHKRSFYTTISYSPMPPDEK